MLARAPTNRGPPLYAVIGGFRLNGQLLEPLIPRCSTISPRWPSISSCRTLH